MEQTILQYGAIGAMLVWFMYRDFKTTEKQVEAQNNNARVINNQNKIMLAMIDTISQCPSNGTNPDNVLRKKELDRLKNEVWNDPVNNVKPNYNYNET